MGPFHFSRESFSGRVVYAIMEQLLPFVVVLGGFSLAALLSLVPFYLRERINAQAFYTQIQKLVMANNVDRAIKLCNAAPGPPFVAAMKILLTRANRSRDMEGEFRRKVENLKGHAERHHRASYSFLAGTVLAGVMGLVAGAANSGSLTLFNWCVAGAIFMGSLRVYVGFKMVAFYNESLDHLINLRNLLWARHIGFKGRKFSEGATTYPPPYEPLEKGLEGGEPEEQAAFEKTVREDIESEGTRSPSWY